MSWQGYAQIAFFLVAIMAAVLIWWLASAHKWFKGPKVQGSDEELAEIELELKQLQQPF